MYGRFINDIFGGFFNLFAGRFWGSEAEAGSMPISAGSMPISAGSMPISAGSMPIN